MSVRAFITPERRLGPPSRAEDLSVGLLVVLTFVTGAVDAVSYVGLDRVFTANMTGNVALLGFAAGGADALPLLRSGIALGAFVLGAAMGGRVMRQVDRDIRWPRPITGTLLTSATILLVIFLVWVGRNEPSQPELAAFGMALAMGLQGSTVRALGIADVPTTVVTSTLTGLASDSRLGGGTSTRWKRRIGTVIALVLGAVASAALIQVSPALGLLPAIAALLTVSAAAALSGMHVASRTTLTQLRPATAT